MCICVLVRVHVCVCACGPKTHICMYACVCAWVHGCMWNMYVCAHLCMSVQPHTISLHVVSCDDHPGKTQGNSMASELLGSSTLCSAMGTCRPQMAHIKRVRQEIMQHVAF